MQTNQSNLRRGAVKLFFIVFAVTVVIDTLPFSTTRGTGPFSFIYDMKIAIRPVLRPIGLWQDEWRLFAPDPVISNCWWTIEVSGEMAEELRSELQSPFEQSAALAPSSTLTWNSPFWGQVSPADKFFKRRRVAHYRRMSDFSSAVVEDFADAWVRERFGNRLHAIESLPLQNAALQGDADDKPIDVDAVDAQTYLLELNVYRNELKLAFPDDGTLPTREETVWLSVTEKHLQRRYGP